MCEVTRFGIAALLAAWGPAEVMWAGALLAAFAVLCSTALGLGAVLAIVLALILIVGLCFGIGALVRTRLGSLSMNKLEQKVFNQIPGYKIANNILKGFLKQERAYPTAMIRLNGKGSAWRVVHVNRPAREDQ